MKSPCKDCEERKPGCHASCLRYTEYEMLCEVRRKERAAIRAADICSDGMKKCLWEKMKRRQNNKKA